MCSIRAEWLQIVNGGYKAEQTAEMDPILEKNTSEVPISYKYTLFALLCIYSKYITPIIVQYT